MANETRPQRGATWDTPTRAQQRYGNVLPPSLRWGARRVPESLRAGEVNDSLQPGSRTGPPPPAMRRDGRQALRLEGQRTRDPHRRSVRHDTEVTEQYVAVETVRPRLGRNVHGSASSNVSAGSTSAQDRAHTASHHSRRHSDSSASEQPVSVPHQARVDHSDDEFKDRRIAIRPSSTDGERQERTGRSRRRSEVKTLGEKVDLGRVSSEDSDESDHSDSVPVYLPPEPKPRGRRGRALGASEMDPSVPKDGSLHEDSKVSIEKYRIYPSTYSQVRGQEELIPSGQPHASLIRSPAVECPKFVDTFEWIHMEQSVLDIHQFKQSVLEHISVGPAARTLIAQNIDDFELDPNQPDAGPDFANPRCERLWGREEGNNQSVVMLTLPLVYLRDSKGGHGVPMKRTQDSSMEHRTLLQMLFPRMGGNVSGQQALYQPGGHSGYLHVTQLWCIMLNGGNEEATLRGHSIGSTTIPPSIKRPSLLGNHIQVVDPDGRTWMLTRELCGTWFEFEVQISEVALEGICFRHEGIRVLPQDWPTLIREHQETSLRIEMYAHRAKDNKFARGTPSLVQPRTATADSIEDFLLFTSEQDTKLYEACERVTAAQAFAGPHSRTQNVQTPSASANPADATSNNGNPENERTARSAQLGGEAEAIKSDLYQRLMGHLWPLTHLFTPYQLKGGSGVSLKFWGAMQAFATCVVQLYLDRNPGKEDLDAFFGFLRANYAPFYLLRVVEQLFSYQYHRNIMIEREQVPSGGVKMPQDFRRAYQEVMLAFLHVSEPDSAVPRRHFSKARKLLKSSFYEVLQSIPRPPLLTREAVGADGLLALFARHCTSSAIPSGVDMITLFSQQITAMEQEVWSGEPSRGPLKSLRTLRNEMAAAGIILQSQLDVLEALKKSLHWRMPHRDYEDQPQRIANTLVEAAKDRVDILPSLEALAAELRAECEAQSADVEDWRSNTQVLIVSLTCHHS
ncbi:hypothetical protein LTR56_004809 [Elasticomyces elasticus]|nr:hypothetical protein LTR56_004809 [Elasticomyces elasticus]KAK3664583.1 hypothetical protein LTR22_004451 [Elasticomyces elasticus]KAK4918449.1 hypothetical protein LTR49_013841 [Elasticomyces elasticus]KAK5760293.1 hypothetical protein LTS12_009507 [Elasticomyces elasticus]